MIESILRFIVGGSVVCAFSFIGSILKPKSFAGLFGAAPSVALATITLTVAKDGKWYASVESRSMILGAASFFIYATVLSNVLIRRRTPALSTSALVMVVWFAGAFGLWYTLLGRA